MPTMEFSDDFNRADSTSLGASWNEAEGNLEIVSNQLKAIDATSAAVVTQAMSSVDQYSQVTWISMPTNSRPILYCRAATTAASNAYAAQFRSANSDVVFYRKVTGTFTSISTSGSITYATGDVLRFEVETTAGDPVLRAYVDGNLIHSYTDTNVAKITTGDYVGVRDSVANTLFDDFSSGILATTSTSTLRVNIGQSGNGVRII